MNKAYTELYEKLSTLQWLLRRQRIVSHAERGPFADPTRGQGRVLAFLRLQPAISSKDLSYLLGIRQQSLNELLNKLEKNELVERKPSEEDKRVMIVHLTEKGKNTEQVETDYSTLFDCLNEEELNTFGEYLDRIIGALEEQVGDIDSEDMEKWMKTARCRMGDEKFERLMAMKHSGFGDNCKGNPHHGPHGGPHRNSYGNPQGSCCGHGHGSGQGHGYGSGHGHGPSNGYGPSNGHGHGHIYGYSYGYGRGHGRGHGHGPGHECGQGRA